MQITVLFDAQGIVKRKFFVDLWIVDHFEQPLKRPYHLWCHLWNNSDLWPWRNSHYYSDPHLWSCCSRQHDSFALSPYRKSQYTHRQGSIPTHKRAISHTLPSIRDLGGTTRACWSLPVRTQNVAADDDNSGWSLQPEQLILEAPKRGTKFKCGSSVVWCTAWWGGCGAGLVQCLEHWTVTWKKWVRFLACALKQGTLSCFLHLWTEM